MHWYASVSRLSHETAHLRIYMLSRAKSEDGNGSTQILGHRLASIQVTLVIKFRVSVSYFLHELDLFR